MMTVGIWKNDYNVGCTVPWYFTQTYKVSYNVTNMLLVNKEIIVYQLK